MLKLKTTAFISAFLLAACGGETSSMSKEEEERIIKSYNLPPEPDADLAKRQIVDTNKNGIRDEVERKIVFAYHLEGADVVKMGLKMAQVKQEIFKNLNDKNKVLQGYKEIGLIVDCLVLKYGVSSDKIDEFLGFMKASIEDTEKRKKEAHKYKRVLSGGTYYPPKKQEVLKFCTAF